MGQCFVCLFVHLSVHVSMSRVPGTLAIDFSVVDGCLLAVQGKNDLILFVTVICGSMV